MRCRVALLVSLVALLAGAGSGAATPPAHVWQDRAPMRQARTEAAYAATGGKIYAIGGFVVALANSTSVEVYDVASDVWTDGPPIPVAVNHAMAAAHAGEVYVAGGYLAAVFGATNTFLVLRGGVWTPLPAMPETRAAGGMVSYGGKLWVVGGFSQQGTLATTTLVYDPRTATWSTQRGLPTPREHLTVVTDGRHVYAAGGRNGPPSTNTGVVERLDPGTGRWTRVRPLATARSGHVSAITVNGVLVSAGGERPGGVIDTVEVYDVRHNRARSLPSLEPGRTGFGAAVVGPRLYVFSGASPSGYLATTQSIDLIALF